MDDTRTFEFNADSWMDQHGWVILWTVAIALIAYFLLKRAIRHIVRPMVARDMQESTDKEIDRRTDTLSGVLTGTAKFVIIVLAMLTVLPELGIDTRALLAGVSVGSLAISFGAQSLVRDALNGIFVLSENHYTIGETVTIAGLTGQVEEVTLRRTVIRDLEGVVHSVPNGSIIATSNHTRDYARIRVIVPVAVGTDLAKVREIVDRVGRDMAADPQFDGMIVQPPSFFRIENLDIKGAVPINVNGIAAPGKQWAVRGSLRARLLVAFQEEGITVP